MTLYPELFRLSNNIWAKVWTLLRIWPIVNEIGAIWWLRYRARSKLLARELTAARLVFAGAQWRKLACSIAKSVKSKKDHFISLRQKPKQQNPPENCWEYRGKEKAKNEKTTSVKKTKRFSVCCLLVSSEGSPNNELCLFLTRTDREIVVHVFCEFFFEDRAGREQFGHVKRRPL